MDKVNSGNPGNDKRPQSAKIPKNKRSLTRPVNSDFPFISKNNKAIYKESQRTYANLIIDVIRQVQKENGQAFVNLDPATAAYSILGMCNSAVMWFDKNGKLGVDALADQMYQMVAANSNSSTIASNDQSRLS